MSEAERALHDILQDVVELTLFKDKSPTFGKLYSDLTYSLNLLFQHLEPYHYHEIIVVASRALLLSSLPRVECQVESIADNIRDGEIVLVDESQKLKVFEAAALEEIRGNSEYLIYSCKINREYFETQGEKYEIPNAKHNSVSVFARPTFLELEEALEDYKNRHARTSGCCILRENAWCDPDRILLRNKPESVIQKSLYSFLDARLRNAHVQREQNVDDSHPIDIKVSWNFTKQDALIEIKWLGASINGNGDDVGTSYSPVRALDGAEQLADYLNQYSSFSPGRRAVGYLVIFDARRRGITKTGEAISCTDGFYYQFKEIEFNPKYHENRGDFESPVRMFAEPVMCS